MPIIIPNGTTIDLCEVQKTTKKEEKPKSVLPSEIKELPKSYELPTSEAWQAMMGIVDKKATVTTLKYGLKGKINPIEIRAILQKRKSNDDNSKILSMLLALINEKAVNPRTLKFISKNGNISEEMAKDIITIFNAKANGIDPNDIYIPHVKTKEDGINKREIGDLFEIDGEKKVYIKTEKDQAKKLKLDKATMIKLFPLAERFANAQMDSGDCYLISVLNSMIEHPKSRVRILSCFEQDGNNIKVKIPRGAKVYTYPNGEVTKQEKKNLMAGSNGMQILEHAYGEYLEDKIKEKALKLQEKAIKSLERKQKRTRDKKETKEINARLKRHNKVLEMYCADLEKKKKEYAVNVDSDKEPIMSQGNGINLLSIQGVNTFTSSGFTTPDEYYRGTGGIMENVFKDFGYKEAKAYPLSSKKLQKILTNPHEIDKYIFTGGTINIGSFNFLTNEYTIDKKMSLYGGHAYRIDPILLDNNKIIYKASNPWNSSHDVFLTFEELEAYFSRINIAKI